MTSPDRVRVAIVGAGVGGIALARRLETRGTSFTVLEKADGVGGTWRWNTYPGAACDVPSHLYSYADLPNPYWSRSYAQQAEILEYLERCADPVRDRLRTGWHVGRAEWDAATATWQLTSTAGEVVLAEVAVFATGMFDAPRLPQIDGLESFAGPILHSARWDHSVGLAGQRVGIIGTGASAIQIFPEVAKVAARTELFQRKAPYVLPRQDRPYTAEEQARFATDPAAMAEVREGIYQMFETTLAFEKDAPVMDVLRRVALDHLAEHVADDELRERLTPGYRIGCNRTLVSTEFYEAIVRDDVDLVTEPIRRVRPEGIETDDGEVHELDVVVCATGFQIGSYLHGIEVVGTEGQELHRLWADQGYPHAYLGMAVSGFPNLFAFYGPNTNQGGNSIILTLEAQAGYVCSALEAMDEAGVAAVDVRPEVLADWDRHLTEAMAGTVWSTGCESYFIGRTGRVVTQMPHTSAWYAERCATFDLADYSAAPRT
jgi:cation diffusion facilitator CzcD-associated flavoprotein CzcO